MTPRLPSGERTSRKPQSPRSSKLPPVIGGGKSTEDSIPDSAIEQFHAIKAFSSSDYGNSITSWAGEKGNVTVTGGSPTVVESGINGYPAVDFNGTDDKLDASITPVSQPNTIFIVRGETSQTGRIFDGYSDYQMLEERPGQPEGQVYAGTILNYIPDYSTPSLYAVVFDGTNSLIRENGTQIASGDVGTIGFDGFSIGDGHLDNHPYNGPIGVVEPHGSRLATEEIESRESALASDYGIAL